MNVVGVVDLSGLEREWSAVRHPSGYLWGKSCSQLRVHVEKARARPTAQPFDRTTRCEINVQFANVERYCPDGLVGVKHDERADACAC